MAKAARKHWAGLTVATQDTADVLGSELGKAVIADAATQVLLRQASQAIDDTHTFDLSAGERQFLLSADRGQGLLSAGTQRVAFQSLACRGGRIRFGRLRRPDRPRRRLTATPSFSERFRLLWEGTGPREPREGMSTNARSKIFFNASPEDARELSRHTAPRSGPARHDPRGSPTPAHRPRNADPRRHA